jgi:large subunit ribosomal protein L14
MIQLRSIVNPADNSGAKSLQVIHVYKGSHHKKATVGDIVMVIVKTAIPNATVKSKEKVKAVVVRTRKEIRREDGSYIRFSDNAVVVIDSANQPRATRIFGPIAREVKDLGFTKIASMATEVY